MAVEQDVSNNNNSLAEPLLSPEEQAQAQTPQDGATAVVKRDVPPASPQDEDGDSPPDGHENNDTAATATLEAFSVKAEIFDMLHLALPLAVSFFCRMGMASTDR
ncbi:MAG: hypothetical protein SGILL_001459 [Bacillariaceae sp.]